MRLRQLRVDKGWSRKELADRAGMGESTIQFIEQGRHFGNPATHKKLADALGVSIAALVYGEEENKPARSLPIPNEITPEQYRFIQALVRFFVAENAGDTTRLVLSQLAMQQTEEHAELGDNGTNTQKESIPVIKPANDIYQK